MSYTNTTTKQLEVVQAMSRRYLARNEMHQRHGGFNAYVSVQLAENMDAMVMTLVDHFAADNIKNVQVQWPLDWWEAVKERFAPEWFKARYPIRFHWHEVDVKAIWQGYRPATEKFGPFLPYVLEQSGRSDACWD